MQQVDVIYHHFDVKTLSRRQFYAQMTNNIILLPEMKEEYV